MASETIVRTRIDSEIKKKASLVLNEMGLSVSDAVRLLLARIAERGTLPFEMSVPNAETVAAMRELEQGEGKPFDDIAGLMADLDAED